MKKKFFALLLISALVLPMFSVSAADIGELQRLYDMVAGHIFKNEQLLSSLITDEEDEECAAAVSVARDLLLSGGGSLQELDNAYNALYSAYSMLTLIEQRGGEVTSDAKLSLLVTLSDIVLTEDFYGLLDTAEADRIRAEALSAVTVIKSGQTVADAGFADTVQRFYELLYSAARLKTDVYTGFFLPAGFYDVSRGDWFCDAVTYVSENGLFHGVSSTEFSPSATMTRAMFITVLSRLASADTAGTESSYTDIAGDAYYAGAVGWAKNGGLLTWANGELFQPDIPVTREEMVVSMYNLCKLLGIKTETESTIPAFSDVTENLEPVSWAYSGGVIRGYEDGSIRPHGTATRAEVAQVFVNFASHAGF